MVSAVRSSFECVIDFLAIRQSFIHAWNHTYIYFDLLLLHLCLCNFYMFIVM